MMKFRLIAFLTLLSLSTTLLSDTSLYLPVRAALLMNLETGEILFSKNSTKLNPPASLAKIMTLYLVFEAIKEGQFKQDQIYKVSTHTSNIGGSQIYLKEGEQISIRELIISTAIKSANDAATALAEVVSGSEKEFVKKMNQKAKQLGLENTIFRTPHGLPQKKYKDQTTAEDIAKLAYFIVKHHPEILDLTSQRISHIRNKEFQIVNTNNLINQYKGMTGLKTGFTQSAGFCLVATVNRKNISLIAVILGANTKKERTKFMTSLLNFGFKTFSNINIASKGKIFDIPIIDGHKEFIKGIGENNLNFTLSKDQKNKIKFETFIPMNLEAPIKKGQVIATYMATLEGKPIAKTAILAGEDLEKAGFFKRLFRQ